MPQIAMMHTDEQRKQTEQRTQRQITGLVQEDQDAVSDQEIRQDIRDPAEDAEHDALRDSPQRADQVRMQAEHDQHAQRDDDDRPDLVVQPFAPVQLFGFRHFFFFYLLLFFRALALRFGCGRFRVRRCRFLRICHMALSFLFAEKSLQNAHNHT